MSQSPESLLVEVKAEILPGTTKAIRTLKVLQGQLINGHNSLLHEVVCGLLFRPVMLANEEGDLLVEAVLIDLSMVRTITTEILEPFVRLHSDCVVTQTKLIFIGLDHPGVQKVFAQRNLDRIFMVKKDRAAALDYLAHEP